MNLKELLPKEAFPKNPYWSLETVDILDWPTVTIKAHGINREHLLTTLKAIRVYFKSIYQAYGSEAQVVIVPKDHPTTLPEMPSDKPLPYKVVIPTQQNTAVITMANEQEWHQNFTPPHFPIARVHSHHMMAPYQSQTDYDSLNSGSLEIVLGYLWDEGSMHLAYWLTQHGDESCKQYVKSRRIPLSQGGDLFDF